MGGTTPTGAFAQTGLTGSGGLGGAGTSFYGGSAFGAQGTPNMSSNPYDWTSAFSGTPPQVPGVPSYTAQQGQTMPTTPAPQWNQIMQAGQPAPPPGEQYMTTDPNSVNFNTLTWAPPTATPAPAAPAPTPAAPAPVQYQGPSVGYPGQLNTLYAQGGVDNYVPGLGMFVVMPDGTQYLNPFGGGAPYGTANQPMNPTYPNAAAQYGGMGEMGVRR